MICHTMQYFWNGYDQISLMQFHIQIIHLKIKKIIMSNIMQYLILEHKLFSLMSYMKLINNNKIKSMTLTSSVWYFNKLTNLANKCCQIEYTYDNNVYSIHLQLFSFMFHYINNQLIEIVHLIFCIDFKD